MKKQDPCGIRNFALTLSHAVMASWNYVVVKGEPDVQKARARLFLFECVKDVLGELLRLLTIRPLEEM